MRRIGLAFALAFVVLLTGASAARAANDPKLLWKSIDTPHFRISFYSTEEDVAEHVATLAEGIYTRLCAAIGWTPTERTEILLSDQTDGANGLTTALPYNAILLNVTAPDDMSPLGDVDDWYLELVTHEFTHILHTDHAGGIPALANRILGKVWAPNQVEPHWMLEGLAVFEESTRTSGGRLRSSMWNMFMRADVLEQNLASLDVFSNTPRRWPGGNIWYLYGSFFMQWLAETYGEQAIRAMIDDYSSQIVPYGINRSVRRATGRTFEELYPAWVDSMRRAFEAQASAVRARGLREGVRVSHTGYTVEHPRWLPANAWPDHAGDLAYFVDDGRSTAGVWALPLTGAAGGAITGGREDRRDLLIRTSGVGGFSFMPNGTAVFSSTDVHENLFSFDDLFELPAHRKSTTGLEGERVRWTDGARALDPSVSPDGGRVVFTTNHRGTTYLMMADVVPASDRLGAHRLSDIRGVVPSETFDQAYTPRWAPDNRHVAYSVWQHGGYRDIRIVDTNDGSFVEVTHDRAIDGDPVFSGDGRWLYYHSDRTGISNVYAYEIATGKLRQVTNVVNGAYQPEPSPDGKQLAYVGYTHAGYDVFVMPLDESRWIDVLPYEETRPPPTPEDPPIPTTLRPYNPLLTLLPRSYSVQISPGNFGQESIFTASGSDIAGLHEISASLTTEFERPEVEGSLTYVYHRIPFDVGVSAFRSISPAGGFALGRSTIPWIEEVVGASVGIAYSMPRAFDGQTFSLSYSAARVAGALPFPAAQLNPYDTPTVPVLGMLGTLHLGWSYANAESYLWSVSPERGFSLGATLDIADPALASDFSGYSARFDLSGYVPMPWLRHHVLALHAGGGASGGNEAGVGAFYVGGFSDVPVLDTIRNYLVQRGSLALRGYPVTFEVGTYYGLLNAEYRFPIVNIDRGPSTLPFFLHRISGSVFADYGSAFNTAEMAEFKTGVGAELWFELTVAYALTFTFHAGIARGLASGGIDKTYFAAVAAF